MADDEIRILFDCSKETWRVPHPIPGMKDIENLVKNVPLPNAEIKDTTGSDYAARIVVNSEEVLSIIKFLGENIDYHNFKDKIDTIPDQSHKPYHRVWMIMAEALGAYGKKGKGI